MEEQIVKKNSEVSSAVENSIEVVADIAEAALESEEVVEGCGEIIGDILDGADDLPILAIVGIISGIIAAIGSCIFIIKKFKKK